MGKRKVVRFLLPLCILAICVLVLLNLLPKELRKGKMTGITLVKPAFAQEITTFPADEAGISAYVNVGQSIDLSKVKNAFRGIEAQGANYIIGIIELTGLPEEEFPHVYVDKQG